MILRLLKVAIGIPIVGAWVAGKIAVRKVKQKV